MRRGGGRDIARVEEGEGRRENEAINSSPLSLSLPILRRISADL